MESGRQGRSQRRAWPPAGPRCRLFAFVLAVALIFALAPWLSDAQTAAKVVRIGYLHPASKGPANVNHNAFRQSIRELGYVEGRNAVFEERFADGKLDRLPSLAAELVGRKVDVIVAVGAPAIRAAKDATAAIPIVMAFSGDDPVRSGIVASLARPGGNVTGLSILATDLTAKLLELLREAVPGVNRIVVLVNPEVPSGVAQLKVAEAAARSLGVELHVAEARRPGRCVQWEVVPPGQEPDAP